MEIKYLKYDEISKLKWDRCINQSFNGIVYAYSWYLDIVSYQWDALVMDDYKAVMPLTFKNNYSVNKIIQPAFAPQLGVFTSERLDINLVNSFLALVPKKYRSVQFNLNTYNKASNTKYNLKQEVTYELDLIYPYKALYLKFSNEAQLKIKVSKISKVNILKHVNLKDLLLLKKNSSNKPLTFEHLNTLRRIIPFCINHNLGETLGAYNDKNELVAGAFFIKSHQKVICLLAACSDQGNEVAADFAIFNHFIKENAEKNLTLDFADYRVYEKEFMGKLFNAIPVNYFKLKRKRFLGFLNKS